MTVVVATAKKLHSVQKLFINLERFLAKPNAELSAGREVRLEVGIDFKNSSLNQKYGAKSDCKFTGCPQSPHTIKKFITKIGKVLFK